MAFQFLDSQNNLILFSDNGKRFDLWLDSVKYTDKPETNVKVKGLEATSYKAKIRFEDPSAPNFESTIYLMQEGKPVQGLEFSYAISQGKKGGFVLRYISSNTIIKEPDPLVPYPPVAFISQESDLKIFGKVYNVFSGTPNYYNNLPDSGNCEVGMSESDLKIACELIKKYNKTEEKLIAAQSVVQHNCVTAQQVVQMTSLIDLEMEKLKLAKAAYRNLADKDKAALVTSAFSFSPTKEEYLKFIRDYKGTKYYKCKDAITNVDLNLILDKMKIKYHDADKSVIAKEAIFQNCFLAEQVKQILQQFNYDNDRLEVAKEAYSKTIDRENYGIWNAVFLSGSSTEKLTNFVTSQY